MSGHRCPGRTWRAIGSSCNYSYYLLGTWTVQRLRIKGNNVPINKERSNKTRCTRAAAAAAATTKPPSVHKNSSVHNNNNNNNVWTVAFVGRVHSRHEDCHRLTMSFPFTTKFHHCHPCCCVDVDVHFPAQTSLQPQLCRPFERLVVHRVVHCRRRSPQNPR